MLGFRLLPPVADNFGFLAQRFLPNRRGLRPSLGTASVLAARGSLNGSEPDWETAGVVGVAPKAQVVPFRVMRGLAGARNLIVVAKI